MHRGKDDDSTMPASESGETVYWLQVSLKHDVLLASYDCWPVPPIHPARLHPWRRCDRCDPSRLSPCPARKERRLIKVGATMALYREAAAAAEPPRPPARGWCTMTCADLGQHLDSIVVLARVLPHCAPRHAKTRTRSARIDSRLLSEQSVSTTVASLLAKAESPPDSQSWILIVWMASLPCARRG